jgi:hypothetical protein
VLKSGSARQNILTTYMRRGDSIILHDSLETPRSFKCVVNHLAFVSRVRILLTRSSSNSNCCHYAPTNHIDTFGNCVWSQVLAISFSYHARIHHTDRPTRPQTPRQTISIPWSASFDRSQLPFTSQFAYHRPASLCVIQRHFNILPPSKRANPIYFNFEGLRSLLPQAF